MEADKVSMSLDDIIKLNKGGKGRGRGRRATRGAANTSFNSAKSFNSGRGRGNFRSPRRGGPRGGVTKRFQKQNNFIPRNIEGIWTHDLFEGTAVRGEGKLLISNLDFGVNDDDMKQLFSDFGLLKKAAVHYDASGRSLGTAEVIFSSKRDAIQAMKQYNTVPLDGRPMKIQIVESSPVQKPAVVRSPAASTVTRGRGRGRAGRQNVNFGQRLRKNATATVTPTRGAGGRGRGRGRGRGGRGGQRGAPLTKEQLDEQLDNYNKMETE